MSAIGNDHLSDEPGTFGYYINLDERGVFHADIRDADGTSLMTITNESFDEDGAHDGYGEIELVETGYMKHGNDLEGLCEYAVAMKIIPSGSRILDMSSFESWLEGMDEDDDQEPSPTYGMRFG